MRAFATLISVFSLASCILSLGVVPDHDISPEASTAVNSLNVPVRPAVALRDIDVDLDEQRVTDPFTPPQLYYNIYTFLVSFWKVPDSAPITRSKILRSFPNLRTLIQPLGSSDLLTTEVAASVLLKLLDYLTLFDSSPRLLTATLKTRATPAQHIGVIRSEYEPQPIPPAPSWTSSAGTERLLVTSSVISSAAPKPLLVTSSVTPSAGTEPLPSDNLTATASVSEKITVHINWNGQSLPSCPALTPQLWLSSHTRISSQIFAWRRADEKLEFAQSREIFTFQQPGPAQCILESKVGVLAVPLGKEPLDMGEIVAGLTTVLRAAVQVRKYEPFYAYIMKDDWWAASYRLYCKNGENVSTT